MLRNLTILLLFGCLSPSIATAQDPTATAIENVKLGFGNQFKLGTWTPVWVTIESASHPLYVDLDVPDGDDTPGRFVDPGDVEKAESKERSRVYLRYVKIGRRSGSLRIRVRNKTETIVEQEYKIRDLATPLASTRKLLIRIGPDIGLAESLRYLKTFDRDVFSVTDASESPELPAHWFGYDGAYTLILSMSQPEHLKLLDKPRIEALSLWVQLGGRLIWFVGGLSQEVAGPNGIMAQLAPPGIGDTVPFQRSAGLESFAGGSDRLELGAGGSTAKNPRLATFEAGQGLTIVHEGSGNQGERPVVTRYPLGLGQIVFVGLDFDHPTIAQWKGRGRTVARFLQSSNDYSNEKVNWQNPIGYTDLSGQLRAAMDQYPGVTLVAFSWVSMIIVAYMVLIGPADYFVLRKLNRSHWTWFTFPTVAILLIALAIGMGQRTRVHEMRVNQVDLIDVDTTSRLVRGTTWVHTFNPVSAEYNLGLMASESLVVSDEADEPSVLLSWQGLPGEGLRGLDSEGRARIFPDTYDTVFNSSLRGSTLANYPMSIASSSGFVGRWWHRIPAGFEGDLTTDLKGERLSGAVRNPFREPLLDAAIYFQSNVYPIDRTMAAGESIRLDGRFPKNLEWRLTRRRVSTESKEVTTPWHPEELDIPRIVEMMMFHSAAGGRNYTQLTLDFQPYVDMSEHLKLNRAILIGRLASRPTTLHRDGKSLGQQYDQQWTYARAILPVRVEKRSGS